MKAQGEQAKWETKGLSFLWNVSYFHTLFPSCWHMPVSYHMLCSVRKALFSYLCFAVLQCSHIHSPLSTLCYLISVPYCAGARLPASVLDVLTLPPFPNACVDLSAAPSVRRSFPVKTSVSQQSVSTSVPNWPVIWSRRPSWLTCRPATQQVEADLYRACVCVRARVFVQPQKETFSISFGLNCKILSMTSCYRIQRSQQLLRRNGYMGKMAHKLRFQSIRQEIRVYVANERK